MICTYSYRDEKLQNHLHHITYPPTQSMYSLKVKKKTVGTVYETSFHYRLV